MTFSACHLVCHIQWCKMSQFDHSTSSKYCLFFTEDYRTGFHRGKFFHRFIFLYALHLPHHDNPCSFTDHYYCHIPRAKRGSTWSSGMWKITKMLMLIDQLNYPHLVYKPSGLYLPLTENIIWFALLLSHLFHENLISQIFTKLHGINCVRAESKIDRGRTICLKIICIS